MTPGLEILQGDVLARLAPILAQPDLVNIAAQGGPQ